jgi:hypothetical protein
MHCSRLLYALALTALTFLPETAFAQTDTLKAEIAAARRELIAAKIEARHFWQVEYPRRRRELNAAIEFADAEIRTLRRQFRSYGPFNTFAYGQLPSIAYRDLSLCLKDAEIRHRMLIDERNNLVRFHSDELQLLELRVAEARDRVLALEGGGLIEFEPGVIVDSGP